MVGAAAVRVCALWPSLTAAHSEAAPEHTPCPRRVWVREAPIKARWWYWLRVHGRPGLASSDATDCTTSPCTSAFPHSGFPALGAHAPGGWKGWGWGPPLNAQQSVKAHGPTPFTRPPANHTPEPNHLSQPTVTPNPINTPNTTTHKPTTPPQSLNRLRSVNKGLASSLKTCGSAW